MKTTAIVPITSTGLVVARPPGPARLSASHRDRFILVESQWAQLGLLTPREALGLARELIDAAAQAGARRAVIAHRARCHRLAHPMPSRLVGRRGGLGEVQR